ncbi:unnamed protein product, partial [Laminaria digitata]
EAPARNEVVAKAAVMVARSELDNGLSTSCVRQGQSRGLDVGASAGDGEAGERSEDSDEDRSPKKGKQHGSNKTNPAAVQLTRGFVFSVEADPDDTWTKIWNGVRAALADRGHKGETRVKRVKRIKGGSSRWQRQELKCQRAGRPSPGAKVPACDRQRKSRSAKCNCPFTVCVSWNQVDPPTTQKVNLEHHQDCTAQATAEVKEAGNL